MLEESRLKQETDNTIAWVKDFVEKSGANGVVVGNSGGKDSATVIAIATKALGKDKVITVAMPCHSISSDLDYAREVSEKFGVKLIEVDLIGGYNTIETEINQKLPHIGDNVLELNERTALSPEAKINMKPRLRMLTLYAIAQSLNCLVIGTGNLCEGMVGYTTKWGDNAADFNPIANFTVEEVLKIGEYLGVPEGILKKAPNDGLGGLTDEEKLGITYKQISEYIETGKTDEHAMKEIEKKYNASKHKRNPIPTYKFKRENYVEKLNK